MEDLESVLYVTNSPEQKRWRNWLKKGVIIGHVYGAQGAKRVLKTGRFHNVYIDHMILQHNTDGKANHSDVDEWSARELVAWTKLSLHNPHLPTVVVFAYGTLPNGQCERFLDAGADRYLHVRKSERGCGLSLDELKQELKRITPQLYE
jgi:hypothetical protein